VGLLHKEVHRIRGIQKFCRVMSQSCPKNP